MSKKLRLYTARDFQKADRLDRIHMHMLEPERWHLAEEEEDYWRKLQQAYQSCYAMYRQGEAVQFIQVNIPGCESFYKANRVYSEMCELFGRFVEVNKRLRRQIVVEKLYAYAERAEQDEDYALASKLLIEAGKMEGLDKPDEVAFNPDDFVFPQIEVSANPKLLQIAEEIDYKEGSDDDE